MGLLSAAATVCLIVVVYLITMNFTPPSARVYGHPDSNGTCWVIVEPNFIVNNVYRVRIVDQLGATIAEQSGPDAGEPALRVVGVASGTKLRVFCDLQYDRFFAACITTQESEITIP